MHDPSFTALGLKFFRNRPECQKLCKKKKKKNLYKNLQSQLTVKSKSILNIDGGVELNSVLMVALSFTLSDVCMTQVPMFLGK